MSRHADAVLSGRVEEAHAATSAAAAGGGGGGGNLFANLAASRHALQQRDAGGQAAA